MTKEAKRAAKIEKKLRVLTGGYQARAQGLMKQISDVGEQLESARLELSTFSFLKECEAQAIPSRMGAITADVERQEERERELQEKYQEATQKLQEVYNNSAA